MDSVAAKAQRGRIPRDNPNYFIYTPAYLTVEICSVILVGYFGDRNTFLTGV